jgi:hypothetical protein
MEDILKIEPHTRVHPAQALGKSGPGTRQPGNLLRRLLDHAQRRLSLNAQRRLLLVFLLIQATFFAAYLAFERSRIEDDAVRILRNTALLEAQQFETSMEAMRYQVRVIGNAFLLNRTVAVEDAEPFLTHELQKDWLDAVIVIDADGDFVAKGSLFPLEEILDQATLNRATFRDRPLFKDLRREEVSDRLFVWRGSGPNPDFIGFVIYRAVRDIEGRYLGGTLGYFNSISMQRLFLKMKDRGFDLGEKGVMAVLDRDTGAQLARIGAVSPSERSRSAGSSLMEFASDSAEARRYVSPVDGVRRIGVFLNVNERRWVLAVGFAEHELLRGWYLQTLWTISAVLAIGILQWQLLNYAHANFLQRELFAREARRDPTGNPCVCCPSISTTSRRSTTATGTTAGTPSSSRWPAHFRACCG